MPNTLSAKKRVRQNTKRNARNRVLKSRMRTQERNFRKALDANDADKAQEQFKLCVSLYDKAAGRKIIHKRNAARNKARLAAMLNNMTAAPAAE